MTQLRKWMVLWLALSVLLVLTDLSIWSIKGHHPSTGAAIERIVHTILEAGILAWLWWLPRGAWAVFLGAFLVTAISGIVFLAKLEKAIPMAPVVDAVVTEALFLLQYGVIAGTIVVWLRHRNSRIGTPP